MSELADIEVLTAPDESLWAHEDAEPDRDEVFDSEEEEYQVALAAGTVVPRLFRKPPPWGCGPWQPLVVAVTLQACPPRWTESQRLATVRALAALVLADLQRHPALGTL